MTDDLEIRRARPDEVGGLAAIELAAAAQFRDVGIDGDYIDEATSPEDFEEAAREGHLWIALRSGTCVGFALTCALDGGCLWLDEIDVHPDHAGRGIGRALIERLTGAARSNGFASVGLSTFREVPWNAPYYAKLGFRELAAGEWSADIREIVEDEKARGLPVETRLVMRLDLEPAR